VANTNCSLLHKAHLFQTEYYERVLTFLGIAYFILNFVYRPLSRRLRVGVRYLSSDL